MASSCPVALRNGFVISISGPHYVGDAFAQHDHLREWSCSILHACRSVTSMSTVMLSAIIPSDGRFYLPTTRGLPEQGGCCCLAILEVMA